MKGIRQLAPSILVVLTLMLCTMLAGCGSNPQEDLKNIVCEKSQLEFADNSPIEISCDELSFLSTENTYTIHYQIHNGSRAEQYAFGTGNDVKLLVWYENAWWSTIYSLGDCSAEQYVLGPGEDMDMTFSLFNIEKVTPLPAGTYRLAKTILKKDQNGFNIGEAIAYFDFSFMQEMK